MTNSNRFNSCTSNTNALGVPPGFPHHREFPKPAAEHDPSISGQILELCHFLRSGGQPEWAGRLYDEYFGTIGMDALRCALAILRDLQDASEVVAPLALEGQIGRAISVLQMAVGMVDPEPAPRVSDETLRNLLSGLR